MYNVQFNRALQKTQCEVISSCVIKYKLTMIICKMTGKTRNNKTLYLKIYNYKNFHTSLFVICSIQISVFQWKKKCNIEVNRFGVKNFPGEKNSGFNLVRNIVRAKVYHAETFHNNLLFHCFVQKCLKI